jgi:diacylglycerol kinase
MLGALSTALRSFRTTIVAGTLWVVALFIALYPYNSDAGAGIQDVGSSLDAIRSAAPDVIPVVGLVFGAYVLGVISEAMLGSAARLLSKRVVVVQSRVQARVVPEAQERANPSGLSDIGTEAAFLETAQGRAIATFGDDVEKLRKTLFNARSTAPGVARQVDVLREEASFRLQLLAPLAGVVVAFCLHAPWAWVVVAVLVGTAALAMIAASANHCAERANDVLADWLAAGGPAVGSPAADTG